MVRGELGGELGSQRGAGRSEGSWLVRGELGG